MQIFLCHSSSDKKYVRELYMRLISDGYEVWLDEVNLIPGQQWDPEIRKQVRKSDIVLVCLSKNSWDKEGYIQREINIALDEADEKPENTIYIIPARIELCTVPDRLIKWQWVDLFGEDGYTKLKTALIMRETQLKKRSVQNTNSVKESKNNTLKGGIQKSESDSQVVKNMIGTRSKSFVLMKLRPVLLVILIVTLIYSFYRFFEFQNVSYNLFTTTLQNANSEKLIVDIFFPKHISPADNWTITAKVENDSIHPVTTNFDLIFTTQNAVLIEDGISTVSITNLKPGASFTHTFTIKSPARLAEDSIQFQIFFDNGFTGNVALPLFRIGISNEKVVDLVAITILLSAIMSITLVPEFMKLFKPIS